MTESVGEMEVVSAANAAARSEFLVPLLFFVGLGKVLQLSRGLYDFWMIVAAVVAMALYWLWTVFRERTASRGSGDSVLAERALAAALLLQSVWLATQPLITYRDHPEFYVALKWSLVGVVLLAAALAWIAWRLPKLSDRRFVGICAGAGVLLLACKVFVLLASRQPWIDVFTCSTEAVDYLLSGKNPYVQSYRDIYHGLYGVPGYGYWPGTLLPQVLSRVLFGDIRAAYVPADALSSLLLYGIARRLRAGRRAAALLPLLWLTFPVTLHVLEMAWIDTFMVLAATLMLWAAVRERWILAGLALGWFCAIKQYSVFFAVLTLLWVLRKRGYPTALRFASACGTLFCALMLPFIAWDPGEFYRRTVGGVIQLAMRTDSFSIPAAFMREWKMALSGQVMTGAYFAAFAAAILVLARRGTVAAWSASVVATYGVVFLFGKQSFCNYYYLLGCFALLQLALSLAAPAEASE